MIEDVVLCPVVLAAYIGKHFFIMSFREHLIISAASKEQFHF